MVVWEGLKFFNKPKTRPLRGRLWWRKPAESNRIPILSGPFVYQTTMTPGHFDFLTSNQNLLYHKKTTPFKGLFDLVVCSQINWELSLPDKLSIVYQI